MTEITTNDVLEAFIAHGAWKAVPTRGRAASEQLFEDWLYGFADYYRSVGYEEGYEHGCGRGVDDGYFSGSVE